MPSAIQNNITAGISAGKRPWKGSRPQSRSNSGVRNNHLQQRDADDGEIYGGDITESNLSDTPRHEDVRPNKGGRRREDFSPDPEDEIDPEGYIGARGTWKQDQSELNQSTAQTPVDPRQHARPEKKGKVLPQALLSGSKNNRAVMEQMRNARERKHEILDASQSTMQHGYKPEFNPVNDSFGAKKGQV